jgi:hypothetical protein
MPFKKGNKLSVTHGESHKTPEYRTWQHMRERCINPNDSKYSYYGGRGITVCEEWRSSYSVFLSDVGRRPSPNHQLDRINNNGNYEPGNVRWTTREEQQRNTSHNRLIAFLGQTKCLTEWAECSHIKPNTLRYRLKSGWDIGLALLTPTGKYRQC